jgi:uncharacterized protein YggE
MRVYDLLLPFEPPKNKPDKRFRCKGDLSKMKSDTKRIKHGAGLFLALLLTGGILIGCTATGGESVGETAVTETEATSANGDAGITVIGTGKTFGQPDKANVTVGVDTFAKEVNAATGENEETIQAIIAAMKAQGIALEDIQTSNYSLWAEQLYGDNGPEGIAGYRVSNQVNITIRDIANVGDVLTAVIEAGANNIYGVYFSVEDPAALEAEARELAIANARERAESLAELSDVALGDVHIISEVVSQPAYPQLGLGGGGGGFDVAQESVNSISPGQLSYQVQVQVTFDLVH